VRRGFKLKTRFGHKRLKPGRYRLIAVPRDAAGAGPAKRAPVTIRS
jgi:hypothetical protein